MRVSIRGSVMADSQWARTEINLMNTCPCERGKANKSKVNARKIKPATHIGSSISEILFSNYYNYCFEFISLNSNGFFAISDF